MTDTFAKVVRAIEHRDLEQIQEWYRQRGFTDQQITWLPLSMVGAIVPGVAAGFLFEVYRNRIALIDGMVSNPYVSADDRAGALVTVIRHLQKEAANRGRTYLLGIANEETGVLAARCGMQRMEGWSVYKLEGEG